MKSSAQFHTNASFQSTGSEIQATMRCLHGLRQDSLVLLRILRPHERLILLLALAATGLASVLPLAATRTAAAHGGSESEINVLFAVDTNKERRDVDHLLAHSASPETLVSCVCDRPGIERSR